MVKFLHSTGKEWLTQELLQGNTFLVLPPKPVPPDLTLAHNLSYCHRAVFTFIFFYTETYLFLKYIFHAACPI